jgi:hypothetical protein
MAQLSNSDRLFLEQRRARKHIGLYVFPALLALLVLVWGALFVWWPLAVNPKAVLGAAESRIIDCGTGALSTYAVSATVLVNVVFVLLSVVVVLGIAWARSERRYLRLLEKFAQEQAFTPVRQ